MPSYNADGNITIKVEIDFYRNGSFVDVTSDVLSFDTTQGFNKEYQQVATPGSGDLLLDNTNFKYSGLEPHSDYYQLLSPNTPIKISATHPSGTYTPSSDNHIYGTFNSLATRVIFAGEIIDFAESSYQNNTPVLKCTIQDYVGRLTDSGTKFPPLYRIPPHTPIDIILDTEFGGQIAHGFFYFVNQPTSGVDHISLLYGSGDAIVFPFVNTLSGGANEILIGATLVDTINNAYQAVNGGAGAGTLYASNIEKPAFCTAQKYGNSDTAPSYLIDNMKGFVLDIIPNYVGTQGNTIVLGTANMENIWISNTEHGDGLLDAKTYLPMYETSGTTAYDYGYNQGGTLTNSTYSTAATSNTGKILRSQYFSLANARSVPITEFTLAPEQFQFAFWMKPPTYASAFNAVLWEYAIVDNGSTRRFVLEYNPGTTATKAKFTLTNWSTFYFGGDINFNWNDWNHIALTYDLGVCKIYVNGTLAYTITEGAPSFGTISSNIVYVGSDKFGARQGNVYISNYKFIGKQVGALSIWDATKIAKYYNRGSSLNNSGSLEGGTAGTTNGIAPYVSVNSDTYFGYIGDDWVERETMKLDAIQQIAASEFGRFFQSRSGQLIYWSNKDWLKRVNGYNVDNTPVNSYIVSNRPFFEASLNKKRLYNSVNVNFSPRIISSSIVQVAKNGIVQVPGQSGTERWNGTVVIPGGGAATLKMDFLNPDTNNKCGAYYIQTPLIGGTHWNANEERDLSGVDYTYYTPTPLAFSLVHNLSGAEITIKNTALGYLWVYNITLYGKIITKESSITYTSEDSTSISNYGKKVLNFDMPLDVNPQFAKEVANWLLNKFKNPIFTVPGDVDFKNMYVLQSPNSANAKHVLEAEIMDELVLYDPSADVEHGISPDIQFWGLGRVVITQISYSYANRNLNTKFRVEGIESAGYFMLDDSNFGLLDTCRLGI